MADFLRGNSQKHQSEHHDIYTSVMGNTGHDLASEETISSVFSDISSRCPDDTLRMSRAHPTCKLYFVGKDHKGWKVVDNLYGWNPIVSVQVFKSRKMASDTAVVTIMNLMGRLDDKGFMDEEHVMTGIDPESFPNMKFTKTFLTPGTRIKIMMGYSPIVEELETVFTGKIATIDHGDMVTFVAQGYGMELLIPIGYDTEEELRRNWKADPLIIMGDLMRARGIKNFGAQTFLERADILSYALDAASRGIAGADIVFPKPPKLEERAVDDNIYLDYTVHRDARFLDRLNFFRDSLGRRMPGAQEPRAFSGGRSSWAMAFTINKSTVWEVFEEIATRFPGYIVSVVPYGERATLFFGLPDQPYWYTDGHGKDSQITFWDSFRRRSSQEIRKTQDYYEDKIESAVTPRDVEKARVTYKVNANEVSPWIKLERAQSEEVSIDLDSEDKKILRGIQSARIIDRYWEDDDYKDTQGGQIMQPYWIEDRDPDAGKNVRNLLRRLVRSDPELIPSYFNVQTRGNNVSLSLKPEIIDDLIMEKGGHINLKSHSNRVSSRGITPLHPCKKVFRGYFYKDSLHHIVHNGLRINLDNFYNRIVIQYHEGIRSKAVMKVKKQIKKLEKRREREIRALEKTGPRSSAIIERIARVDREIEEKERMIKTSIKLKNYALVADDSIEEDYYKTKVFYERNAATNWDAAEFALGHLWREMKEMYDGDVIILGDPKIKPYDRVYMYDFYNEMYGPIEVRDVVHEFSLDTGFVTTITPDLVVHVNDPNSVLVSAFGWFIANAMVTGAMVLSRVLGISAFARFMCIKIGRNMRRREPVQITPMTYRDKPYVAGLEGIRKTRFLEADIRRFFRRWVERPSAGIRYLFGHGRIRRTIEGE